MKDFSEPYPVAVELDGTGLTVDTVARVARSHQVELRLSASARQRMEQSRAWVEEVERRGEPVVYGINTGFGSQARVVIRNDRLRELQRNLILSHAAGVGEPLPVEVVRAAMLLRANTLARGFSGVRVEVVETLLRMLEKNVVPVIPSRGSLGASGDLAPLSHLALVLSRDPAGDVPEYSGRAYVLEETTGEWQLLSGKEAMERADIPRLVLEAKEGLALNNGTQISTALLALACHDARQLLKTADIAMAMTLEALLGISEAYRPEIHQARPHEGQIAIAENIRRLTDGSTLLDRHPEKVQDAYSLRCHPQVLGAVRDTLDFVEGVVQVEMNSSNDNPLIFPELEEPKKALSGGNFHAQPVAFAADFLGIALCEIGSIAERRIFRLSDRNLNEGLPPFLSRNPGVESGLMIAQYTAAALVSENKSLAHPASVDSIPSSENQEDHVSMAPIAARKARQILENVRKIVAIEILYAAQALDLRRQQLASSGGKAAPWRLGKGTAVAYGCVREQVPFMDRDRPVYRDIEAVLGLVRNEEILRSVEAAVGRLR